MGTPICDPKLLVKPSTSSEALAALDEAQHQIIAGEVAQLVAITHIADLWKIDQTVVAEGMEQLIRPGHDGTPKVGEFVAAEVGALLGLPRSTALARIGEALDLRTRHPKLWEKVIAGTVRVWEARKICSECAHLPLETVLVVDEAMTASDIDGLPFNRMMKALEGQIVAADTNLARERAETQRTSRKIRVSKIRDGCMSIFGIVDPADGINFNQLLTDIATALPVKPDTALYKDLDRRRNLAFSMIVRDAYAKAHSEQPIFELRYGELVPLPPGRVVGVTPDGSGTPSAAVTPPASRPRVSVAELRARMKARQEQSEPQAASPVRPETASGRPEAPGSGVPGPGVLGSEVLDPEACGRLPFDTPVVDPDDGLKILTGHIPETTENGGPIATSRPCPADQQSPWDGSSRDSVPGSGGRAMPSQAAGGAVATGRPYPDGQQSPWDGPSCDREPGSRGPTMPSPAGGRPQVDEPTVHGPVLYDTPAAAQLAGIAGTPNPVKHTLVIHISANDPALRAAGAPSAEGAEQTHPAQTATARYADGDRYGQPSTETTRQTGVARIEGWGPLLTEQLPEFLAGSKVIVRPVIDPAGMRPVDCYETPNRMRFAIEQRNPVDVFPYGTTPASHCDMDHTIPFAAGKAGQTHPGNLGPLSRTAHRAKTHGGWKLEQPEPGIYQWTSPHGYQYQVTATGTTRIQVPEKLSRPA